MLYSEREYLYLDTNNFAKAVWESLKKFVKINIREVCYAPSDQSYRFDRREFDKMMPKTKFTIHKEKLLC